MSRQGGMNFNVTGVREVQRFLAENIAGQDLREATGELRKAAKQIAVDIVIPALAQTAAASGVPIAPAIAATAMPRADRVVTVSMGRKNPKLRNYKRGTSQRARTSLAFGAEWGDGEQSRQSNPAHKVTPRNRYGVPRNTGRGYIAGATAASREVHEKVRAAYLEALRSIMSRYGKW